MGLTKREVRWVLSVMLLMLAAVAPSAAQAQSSCQSQGGEDRAAPYCFNVPGTPLPLPADAKAIPAENASATTEAGERTACADGEPYGKTLWMTVSPQAPGYLLVVEVGIDARLVVEDPATGQFICSDDTFDGAGNEFTREGIAVRGLEAGKTYLVQIGGRTRQNGSPSSGNFGISAGFVPDRDGDDVGDAEDSCPDVRATGGCPSGSGDGGAGGSGGGGGALPPATPGLSTSDPDPDMDGIRGPADKCPDKGTRGRDINQDGCEDRKRQEIDVKWRIVPTKGSGIVMRELRLSDTRKGTKVTVKCSKGCKRLSLSPTKSKLNVSAKKMRAGRLRPGTTIEVSVSRAGYNGETHRYTVTKTTMVESWTRCLPEGTSTPVKGACY
jgi:hypothetical protein